MPKAIMESSCMKILNKHDNAHLLEATVFPCRWLLL